MQDFRVKSGLRVDGNVYGVTNLTVTYSGLFGNVKVTGVIEGNVIGTVSSLDNHSINALADVNTVSVPPLVGYGLIWDGTNWAPNVITVSDTELANVANSVLGIVQESIAAFQANTALFAEEANVANLVLTISNFTTTDLVEGDNLYFTPERVIESLEGNNVTVNNLIVSGDLEVQGNTVTVNAATLTIEDKNILLANGATSSAQADGAGITIAGADVTILYDDANVQLAVNTDLEVQGNVNITATTESANGSTEGALTISGGAYIAGNVNIGGAIFSEAEPVINLGAMNQSLALLRAQVTAPSGNVLYVNGNGNDANDGFSYANALANVHTALNRAEPWTTVFVKSGDYVLYEQPVTIKNRVGLVGDNLRTTTIRPNQANVDMFYVENASYATGITFRDHISPAAVFSYNPDGSAGTIITSPYIQNCSSITTTGTGMRVDGNYVRGLRSMVCDSYTQTNAGGIGIHMLNKGYTQLVSVFTICCEIAILAEEGGFCSITNSNSSFGTYGLVSRGVSQPNYFGKIKEIIDTDDGQQVIMHDLDDRPKYGDAVLIANYNQEKCSRDTGLIVDSLAFDLAYQSNTQSAFAGLQYWAQQESAIPNQAVETIAAFNYAKDLATNVALDITITSPRQANVTQTSGTAGAWVSRISDGFDLVANIITGGTIGITDRIIPNGFPANTNVDVNNAANLVLSNKEFIQKEVIAFVNQEYPGFFANSGIFIDQANAATKCERDTGYLIESIVFDFLHDGNRQAITSGVFYYNNDFNTTQIQNQVIQTTAAYDFIGTIIDEIITLQSIANTYQTTYLQNTTAAPAASLNEAATVLNSIDLITDIITIGANAAPVKSPISYSTLSTDSNVINAAKIILANRDFIVAEVNGYINRNWANISNGTVAFFTVANSSPLGSALGLSNVSYVTLLETVSDSIFANSAVSFHQPSYISASGHTFEYVGSGNELATALPYAGGFPIQENEVIQERGGQVYFTSTDQQGDFRIGTELVINRVDGTISGRTFTKALFSVMTPYILAVEG